MAKLSRSYVFFLVLLALLPAAVQAVYGVRLTGINAAADGAFTVGALAHFGEEFSSSSWLVRWIWSGNNGLGSPLFYIYPPGAYLLSMPLHLAWPQLPTATVIDIMELIFRALAVLTCGLWLWCRYGTTLALAGGAFYGLMPYVAYYNPDYRLAYAESSAAFILPLVFLSIDIGKGGFVWTTVLAASSIFLLVLFHLPSIVIVGVLSVVYGASLAKAWREAVNQGLAVICGVVLGLALAAFNIIPAIALLPDISASALQNFNWQGFFLLRFRDFTNPYYLILDTCLLIPVLAVFATRKHWRNKRELWPIWIVFAVSVFLTLPISYPAWKIMFPLQRIQFPWRFLLPMSLMASALCVSALRSARPKTLWGCAVIIFLMSAITTGISLYLADPRSDVDRTNAALQAPYVDAPEYMPVTPATKGWLNFHQKGGDSEKRAAALVSPCLNLKENSMTRSGKGMVFNVAGCNGVTVFPQFYFPGWTAETDELLEVKPDPLGGLVMVNISRGSAKLVLAREHLPQEIWGVRVSLTALAVWIGCVFFRFRQNNDSTRATECDLT